MICPYCKEQFLEGDVVEKMGVQLYHHECVFRMGAGSVAHIEHRCSCFVPGSVEDDPTNLTTRAAAKVALEAYRNGMAKRKYKL